MHMLEEYLEVDQKKTIEKLKKFNSLIKNTIDTLEEGLDSNDLSEKLMSLYVLVNFQYAYGKVMTNIDEIMNTEIEEIIKHLKNKEAAIISKH